MQFIQDNCSFGQLCWINSTGDAVQTPIRLPLKMETLLEAAKKQRELHIENLPPDRKKHVVDATYEIDEDDMKAIYNLWRRDTKSWMNPASLMKYKQLLASRQNAAAQKLGKQAFSAYLFQLSGSKFLLHKLIQLPILPHCSMVQSSRSAAPPAARHPFGLVS